MKKTLTLSIFTLFFLSSCLKDKATPISQNSGDCFDQSYYYNIRPIIETSCKTQAGPGTGCHDAWIDDYAPIANYIDNNKWQTEIFVDKTMPEIPNIWGIDSLTDDELKIMQCWIDQGYPEN